jgi:hypothetical protein
MKVLRFPAFVEVQINYLLMAGFSLMADLKRICEGAKNCTGLTWYQVGSMLFSVAPAVRGVEAGGEHAPGFPIVTLFQVTRYKTSFCHPKCGYLTGYRVKTRAYSMI